MPARRWRRGGALRRPGSPCRPRRDRVQARGARQSAERRLQRLQPRAGVADHGCAPCLAASNAATLSPTRRRPASANSAREPVVKSCSRVPMPTTRSASAAAALAALVPVTPMAPSAIGWSQGSAPLPAWVSADRDAVRLRRTRPARPRRRRRARRRRRRSAAPWRRAAAAPASSDLARIGRGGDGAQTRSSNKLPGNRAASACTSWQKAERRRAARGRIGQHRHRARQGGTICSGRVMRSK